MAVKKSLEKYIKGAQNLVKLIGIGKGNEVVIVCTRQFNRREIDAVAHAVRSVGAHIYILEVEEKAPNQPYPPIIRAIGRGINFRILMGSGPSSLEKDGMVMASDYGISEVTVSPGFLEHEAGRYPVELWYEINNLLKRRIGHTAPDKRHVVKFRVTDANGSDFQLQARYPEDIGAYIGTEPLVCGGGPYPKHIFRGGFPMGLMPCGDLLDSGNGALAAEYRGRFMNTMMPLRPPLRLIFKDGLVTDIQGGPQAEILKEQLAAFPNANHLREFAIGTNPHIPLPALLPKRASAPGALWRAGNLSIGLGGDSGVSGRRVGSELFSMPMLCMTGCTIYADDEIIVDKGRLPVLEEPALRESAWKYGDPEKLLTPV